MIYPTYLTPSQMAELQISADKGYADRAEFYYKYYLMTGSQQALLQAQITTYSGPIGGLALFGNYLAKTQDQDLNGNQVHYKLTLDEFTMDIRDGFIKAVLYAPKNSDGTTKVLNDSELQVSDYNVWKGKGMGYLFPGNLQFLSNSQLPAFIPAKDRDGKSSEGHYWMSDSYYWISNITLKDGSYITSLWDDKYTYYDMVMKVNGLRVTITFPKSMISSWRKIRSNTLSLIKRWEGIEMTNCGRQQQ